MLDFFRTGPLMARNKVVVFESADRMNSTAANAFLKTLEEPSPTSKIILTTDEFTRVIPTVRSRCMCLACELPSKGSAALGELSPVESVFGGSPGGVFHVREHAASFERLYALLESTLREPLGSAFKLAEECRAVSDDYAKSAELNARAAHVKALESIAAWLAVRKPERPDLLRSVAEAHRRVLGNAQAGTVFENLFLDLLYYG